MGGGRFFYFHFLLLYANKFRPEDWVPAVNFGSAVDSSTETLCSMFEKIVLRFASHFSQYQKRPGTNVRNTYFLFFYPTPLGFVFFLQGSRGSFLCLIIVNYMTIVIMARPIERVYCKCIQKSSNLLINPYSTTSVTS